MQLRTQALDCLYLNWALPRSAAPALPPPLRYEVHEWQEEEWVFASALLFRLSGLRLERLSFLRLSYPQMNLRLYVFDQGGAPSVFFLRTLVPPWMVPASRLLGRQPAAAARFSYPPPGQPPGSGVLRWTVRRRQALTVSGQAASPGLGHGPRLGSWERTVDYFRHRRRGYVLWQRRLRSIHLWRPPIEVCPLAVEVEDVDLVAAAFAGRVADEHLRQPHSSWLCPEIPFVFELGKPIRLPLAPPVAAAEGFPRV